MLHRYTDQERTVVRNKYGRNAMMRVAEIACRLFDSQLQDISLWPEELFAWAAVIMDDVKENGDQYMTRIGDLWKEHYRQLRSIDKSMPQDELKLTASIILYVPTLMLQTSNDSVHRYMGKQMLDSVSMNYDQWAEAYTQMTSACQRMKPKMGEWVNDFMALENEEYLSDEIDEVLEMQKPVERKSAPAPRPKSGFRIVSDVFTYKWAKQHPERVTAFYQYLVKLHAIDKDTDHEEFEKLFMGTPTGIIIRWLAPKSALKALMSELKKREYISPAGRLWAITESHFKGADNKLFSGLRNEHDPKYLAWIIKIIADTLDPKTDIQPINMLNDDMADELWSGVRDKGFTVC